MLRVEEGNQPRFESRDQLKQLLIKIHLMKSYATEQGMSVPPEVAEKIANLGGQTEPSSAPEGTANRTSYGDLQWMSAKAVGDAL
jgi:hypothetical protein